MKKVLFVLVAVAALTITSCCNKKAKETTCDKAKTECVADKCSQKDCDKACDKACDKSECKKDCDKA